MRLAALTLVALAASAASGCGAPSIEQAPVAEPTASERPVPPAEPPAPTPAVPSACSAGKVEALVKRFLQAFNAGDIEALDMIFAAGTEFRWYSTEGPGADVGGRGTLMRYFERRHRKGERLQLEALTFNGNDAGFGHFEYELVRRASDLEPVRYLGKGAAICRDRDTIAVWSMGRAR